MRPVRLSLWAACALLFVAVTAHGENALTSRQVKLTPTFASIGIEIDTAGDLNRNAKGELKYRAAGEQEWHTGHFPMRIGKNRWATSVLFLNEATEYEVQIRFEDADGVKKQPEPAQTRTLDSKFPVGSGSTYYADPAAAAGGDGSKERPFKTVEQALKRLKPGETVRFAKGLYHLGSAFKTSLAGNAKAWIYLRADPGAVLTDATPELSGVGKLAWEKHKQDAAGNWIYKTAAKNVTRVAVRKTPGELASGWFLWRFVQDSRGPHCGQSLQDLEADSTSLNDLGAFFQDAETLYLTLPKGVADPAQADFLIVQAPEKGLQFTGHHVLLEGFTLEGTPLLIVRDGGHHFAFRRLTQYGSLPYGMWTGPDALLEDCRFVHTAIWTWLNSPLAKNGKNGWSKIKNGYNDTLMVRAFSRTTIRHCEFIGHSNALASDDACHSGSAGFNDVDIHHCLFREIGDDAIEPDTKVTNLRIWRNKILDAHNGVSSAPFEVGPAFVVGNLITGYLQAAVKMRNKTHAVQLYYHNTCYPGGESGSHAFAPDGEGASNIRTRNNVFVASHYAYYIRKEIVASHGKTLDFDFNSLGSLQKKVLGFRGEKTWVDAIPAFLDRAKGDWRLAPADSAFVDAGEVLPGINADVPEPFRFRGKAPDLGAFETGSEPWTCGVRP